MNKKQVLFGICGSFCNHKKILDQLAKLTDRYDLTFVISENTAKLDTRFFQHAQFRKALSAFTTHDIIDTIPESEKVGPKNQYDVMVIAPASATTISKLVNGIYDTSVTLAAKAILRNDKPILIGLSTNDFIGISGANLLQLIARKNMYTLPMYQDDIQQKPRSMSARFDVLEEAIEHVLQHQQMQPVFVGKE